jgi:hypothetical protein
MRTQRFMIFTNLVGPAPLLSQSFSENLLSTPRAES